MFHLPKLERYMISLLKPLEGGLLKIWLTPELLQTLAGVERGCMILNRSVVVWNQKWMSLHHPTVDLNKDLRSFIVEFHQTNKYLILNDSKHCYRLLSQIVKSLPTLAQVSTTTSQGSPDWWKWYVGNRSEGLWLPSETDSCASDTNSSRKCVKSMESKSWFTLTNTTVNKNQRTWKRKNFKRTSCPSLTSSLPDETEKNQECSNVLDGSKESPNSILKIRLYPTRAEKDQLRKMFTTHRKIYNKLVSTSKDDCYALSLKDINRKYRPISQKHSLTNYLPDYHLAVPEEVMDSTYRDFLKAIKSSKALYFALKEKEKTTTFPTLKYKSIRDNTSSIEIRSRTIKVLDRSLRLFPTYFGFKKEDGIAIKEVIPNLNYSVRLQRTREGRYYVCIPRGIEYEQTINGNVCAIDPGVRSFITIYDPNGLTVGVDDSKNYVFNKCLWIDRLQSKLSGSNSKRERHRLRKTIYRGYQRIKSMIADMHHKVSKWMSENYNEVLLPTFETSQMTSRQKRISSKTTRAMLTWAHYKFKMLLKCKMERTGGRVIECGEHYTTKTCSRCGRINRNIKAQKIFMCSQCNLVCDRDVNAARNIFLKNEHLLTWTNRVRVSEMPTPWLSGIV